MKRAVFLDRDGVLNRSMLVDGVPKPPSSVDDVEILEGVIEAIRILKNCDLVPVVVTNQPDVARGQITKFIVNEINAHIGNVVGVENFYTCFHDDNDFCKCRKPAPGLIIQAAYDLDLDLNGSFMVGDRWRDISAGQSVGCVTYFIDYSYPEPAPNVPFRRVSSLLEAAKHIKGDQDVA
jgi:D-glycero-D-manno-heptose 1,7-bisphosphate phosphatase